MNKLIIMTLTASTLLACGAAYAAQPNGNRDGRTTAAAEFRRGPREGAKYGPKEGARRGARQGLKYGLKNGLKKGLKNGLKNGEKK